MCLCIYIAPEITEENFEDLLAYDDVLVDYFNAFLCLPVSFFHKIGYVLRQHFYTVLF